METSFAHSWISPSWHPEARIPHSVRWALRHITCPLIVEIKANWPLLIIDLLLTGTHEQDARVRNIIINKNLIMYQFYDTGRYIKVQLFKMFLV